MQTMFPFSVGSNFTEDAYGLKQKAAETGQSPSGDGAFASFLSVCTQAVEQVKDVERAAEGTALDLKLFASQGDVREECSATLPLGGAFDMRTLSGSVLELAASIKNGLEEKGFDTKEMAETIEDILSETFPDMDLDRIKAAVSKLRSRYAMSVGGDAPQTLDLEVALTEDLRIGLEASLKTLPEEGPLPSVEEELSGDDEAASLAAVSAEGKEVAPPLSEADPKDEEAGGDALVQSMALSRLFSYLKADAPRNDSLPQKEAADVPMSAKVVQEASGGKTESPVFPASATSQERNASDSGFDTDDENDSAPEKTSLDKNGAIAEKNMKKARSEPVAEYARETSSKTDADDSKTSGFEQFFEGILSRRRTPEAQAPALDLGAGKNLSRGETLRDGVENVVRFMRSGGEQKASLIVDPPALGRISVELTSGTSGLEASIKVGSEQIRQLVQDQIVQLRMTLAQQGVQLTQFSVDVQQDNGRHGQGFEQDGRGTRRVSGKEVPDDAQDEQSDFRVDLNQGLLYWVA